MQTLLQDFFFFFIVFRVRLHETKTPVDVPMPQVLKWTKINVEVSWGKRLNHTINPDISL